MSALYDSRDLSDVCVTETSICEVRGDVGELSYRGHTIETLVQRPFLQVAHLVLFATLPSEPEQQRLRDALSAASRLSSTEINCMSALPLSCHPMAVLQSLMPLFEVCEDEVLQVYPPELRQGITLIAKMSSALRFWRRRTKGECPDAVGGEACLHSAFLQDFLGRPADAEELAAFDCLQILQMEHSVNVSTYAAIMTAGTKADLNAVFSAALASLSGPLHGGADEAALSMARRVADPQQAGVFVREALAKREVIMGMGHREYKVVDPRARIIKPLAQALCTSGDSAELLSVLVAMERACHDVFAEKGKTLWANMEFYKGVVMQRLGIADDYFTAVFAMSRAWGWLAHYMEFSENPRLIRPQARYIPSS